MKDKKAAKQVSVYEALLSLKTEEEAKLFFRDLCTPSEIRDLEERWLVAQLLDQGKLSYRQIQEKTGTSVTTVGRVARFLKDEPYKGYRLILDRLSA